jgi:hypothetical protein
MSANARHAMMDHPGSRRQSTDAITAFHRSGSNSDDDRDTLLATAALWPRATPSSTFSGGVG